MPRRERAYRQGDLDELCGAYAVVNSLRFVLPLNDAQCRQLFARLITALGQDRRRPHEPVVKGMHFRQLKRLVQVAGTWRCESRNLAFRARPLNLKRDQRTLPRLWAALGQETGPTCVAIVGIAGAIDHWCVVHRVTPKTLWLLDSAGRTRINRSRCTLRSSRTRYCLDPSEILLIARQY